MGDRIVERKESMSPDGRLRLIIQDDGDVIVTVLESDPMGSGSFASVEFCTPFSGGGGSSRTWDALRELALAMAEDNRDPQQQARCGEFLGEGIVRL